MFFKNLQIYRVLPEWEITASDLEQQLARRPFTPPGAQGFESRGWVSPADDGALVCTVGDNWMICLQTEAKILPAAVVKQIAEERADEFARQQGYKLGPKNMKDLREQVTQELLPRAFARRRKAFAWLNIPAGWLVVDASSQSKAEDVLEQLRHSLNDFPVTLLRTERSPMSAMADWLAANEAPAGFTIDQDCELHSLTEDRAAVRYARHPLEGDEVKAHLEAGKLPTRLAMTYEDRVSFVLTAGGELKRLEFLDVVRESIAPDDQDDAQALFDAEFALMAGELLRQAGLVVELRSQLDAALVARGDSPPCADDEDPSVDILQVAKAWHVVAKGYTIASATSIKAADRIARQLVRRENEVVTVGAWVPMFRYTPGVEVRSAR